MPTGRLEAFSDGVFAVAITIMVLALHTPDGTDLSALWDAIGAPFAIHVLSFIYVGIYWNNHHHMFQIAERVNGAALWANLHLLFWVTLLPFTTGWMGETDLAPTPVVVYGINLFMAAAAFALLERAIIRLEGESSRLRAAITDGAKERLSMVLYLAGIIAVIATAAAPRAIGATLAVCCYAAVAVLWLIPDRRIERLLADPAQR